MAIPTEAAVSEYMARFRAAGPYYRQFLECPFWLSRRYYDACRNGRRRRYICRAFVRGMCWRRGCARLHDVVLYRRQEPQKDVFGDALAGAALHSQQRAVLLTALRLGGVTADLPPGGRGAGEEAEEAEEAEGGDAPAERVANAAFAKILLRGVRGLRLHKQTGGCRFQMIIQFESTQHAQVAAEALNHKDVADGGERYKLYAQLSEADIF